MTFIGVTTSMIKYNVKFNLTNLILIFWDQSQLHFDHVYFLNFTSSSLLKSLNVMSLTSLNEVIIVIII